MNAARFSSSSAVPPTPMEVSATRGRMTPPPATGQFKQVLSDSAQSLMGGLEAAGAWVPGGPVVSAAVRAARTSGAGSAAPAASSGAVTVTGQALSTESPEGPGGAPGYEGLVSAYADDSMRLIMLQQQIQNENRQFTTLSNVLKARHETAKNAIGNIR